MEEPHNRHQPAASASREKREFNLMVETENIHISSNDTGTESSFACEEGGERTASRIRTEEPEGRTLGAFMEDEDKTLSFSSIDDSSDDDQVKLDSLLAQEMLKLNVDDREKAFREVNAVPDRVQEDPEILKHSFLKLRHLLVSSPEPIFQEALAHDETTVTSQGFLLPFLRAEDYDIELAAGRVNRYLQFKRDNFGSNCMARPVTMDDLDSETSRCVKSGCLQILPLLDQAKRPVILCFLPLQLKFQPICRVCTNLRMIIVDAFFHISILASI